MERPSVLDPPAGFKPTPPAWTREDVRAGGRGDREEERGRLDLDEERVRVRAGLRTWEAQARSDSFALVPIRPRRRGARRSLRRTFARRFSPPTQRHGFNPDARTSTPFNSDDF